MKTTLIFFSALLCYVIGLPIGFTQETIENPQWHLPEGAIARLGKGTVNDITYAPDGTQFTIVSSIGMWVYDVQTGEPIDLFTGHTDIVSSAAYSPDGSTLASGSWDNTLRLWDAHTGHLKTTLSGHKDRVVSLAYSPDGSTLASGSWDSTLRLWDIHTGQPKTILIGHAHRVNAVAFSPDGSTLASADEEGEIRLWDVDTGQTLAILTSDTQSSPATAFSPDGTTLATGTQAGTVQLWDVGTGQVFADPRRPHQPRDRHRFFFRWIHACHGQWRPDPPAVERFHTANNCHTYGT